MKRRRNLKDKQNKIYERDRIIRRLELSSELHIEDMSDKYQLKLWRRKLMNLSLPIIKTDFQVAWRTFDRALDNKDSRICTLFDVLKSAKGQRKKGTTINLIQIHRLLEVHKKQLEKYETCFKNNIQNSLKLACNQIDTIQQEQKEKKSFLQIVICIKNQGIEEVTENIKTKNLSKLDTSIEENENLQKLNEIILKRYLHNFSQDLKKIVRNYKQNSKEKNKDLEVIKQKDIEDQRIIARQSVHIENLSEIIKTFKNKITNFQLSSKKIIADYKFEHSYFQKAYIKIQNRLLLEQILDKEQLRIINKEYNVTIKYLKNYVTKLEKVLTVINLCQKYERFEERNFFYPLSFLNYETNFRKTQITYSENNETHNVIKQIQPIQKFLNFVILKQKDIIRLKHQSKQLNEESNFLNHQLKLYMKKVSNSMLIKIKI